MADDIQSNRIICEGGLDSTENHINLSLNKPGAATRGINYEVGLDGGYSKIGGYTLYDSAYGEVGVGVAEGRVLGIMLFEEESTGSTTIFAARKDAGANEYSIYKYTAGVGWVAETLGFTLVSTNVLKIRYKVGSDSTSNYMICVDGVNNAYMYNGTAWTRIISSNTGADFANAGGNQAVDAPSLVDIFQQTLFLGGDASAPGAVAYSAAGDFSDFTAASGGGQAVIGFKVVQIKPFRDDLFVFGLRSIKRIIPDVTSGFLVTGVTGNIGCIAPDSVLEIGGSLVFLAPDGFRPVAGTQKIGDVQLETISKPIHSLIRRRINAGLPEHVNGVVIRGKSQFRVFFSSETSAASSSRGILGSLRTPDQQNGWEFFETIGFRCSTVTSDYIDGVEVVLHGDFDGKVYKQEVGGSLNGDPMLCVYKTPFLDFGDTETRKVFEKISIFLKTSASLTLTLTLDYDWADSYTPTPTSYPVEVDTNSPVYGPDAAYGTSTYGGVLRSRSVTNVEGSFFSASVTVSSYDTNDPYSIHGLIFEYKEEGRR